MRKTFVWLGLAASVHMLPASAHNSGPAMMPSASAAGGGFAVAHSSFPTTTHASSFATQHHAFSQSNSQAAPLTHGAANGFQSFSSHLSNFNQLHTISGQPMAQVGPHTWAAAQAVQLVFASNGSLSAGSSINLDLSSTQAVVAAAFLKGTDSVTIDVGGKTLTVSAKSQLTPAEYLAAMAVAAGQPQSLVLDARGSAVGGSVVVNQRLGQTISSLVIPQGVTVTDVSRSGTVKVSGDVSDSGNFYLSGAGSGPVTLRADNVTVTSGGLLSDSGSSSGLVVNAGGAINNAGTIASATGVSLSSGSGSITNSGLVASTNGSITLSSPSTVNLSIDATGGAFKAGNGDINLRENNYAGSAAINLNGGDYFSNNLNINAGAGVVEGSIGQVSGSLNTTAMVAHLSADTSVLTLGKQTISGDPTFANTGTINIDGQIQVDGANLAIIAGGNIISVNPSASIIDHGGDVLLIAGGVVTGGSTDGTSVLNSSLSGASTDNVTVSLFGGTGGSIDFSGVVGGTASTAPTVIDTSAVASQAHAGNITLVALTDGAGNGGVVAFNQGIGLNTIDTRSAQSTSGNVTVVAGATTGNAIVVNAINTGGGVSGGSVSLTAGPSTTNDSKSLTIDASGTVISFNHVIAGAPGTGGIVYTNIDTSITGTTANDYNGTSGNVNIAGGNITGTGTISANGAANNLGGGGNGGSVSIYGTGSVSISKVSTVGGAGENSLDPTVTNSLITPQSRGGSIIISAVGDVTIQELQSYGGDGGIAGGNGSGGVGGQGGLISVSSTGGSIVLLGGLLSSGGAGSQVSSRAPSGGSAGDIILSAYKSINATLGGNIEANGGNTGAGAAFPDVPSNGGNAGEILFIAGTTISTNANKFINALPGAVVGAGGTIGASGNVTVVATDDIVLSPINVGGNAGSITVVSTFESVTIGSTTNPQGVASLTATNGGVVTVVANTGISMLSVDASGNAITTGSAFIAAGATSTISFGGGNIATAGNNASGEAWVLQASGTVSPYLVNGAANANQFLTGKSGGIGEDTVDFTYGNNPVGYIAGPTNVLSDTSHSQIFTGDNANMLIPVVSNSTMTLSGNFDSFAPVGFFSSSNIKIATPTNGLNIQDVISTQVTPLSPSTPAVALSPQGPVQLGTVAAIGQVNFNPTDTVTGLNLLYTATGAVVNAANFTPVLVVTPGTSAIINTTAAQSAVSGSFYTGGQGSIYLTNAISGGTLNVGTVIANTADLEFQSDNVAVGVTASQGSPVTAIVANNATGGAINFRTAAGGDINISLNATLLTDGGGAIIFAAAQQANATLTLSGQTNIIGGGNIYISAPNLAFTGTLSAQDKSNIFLDGGSSASIVPMSIGVGEGSISTNGGIIAIHPTGDLAFINNGGPNAHFSLDAAGSNGDGLVNVQGLGNVTLNSNFSLMTDSPIQFNMNAGKTITISDNSEIKSNFSGNSTFPDPLGGTFSYSILFQNLISNFNIAGTGFIVQNGAVAGNTVFNDFVDVGFADNTNLTFINSYSDPTGASGFVNFFTRQIQVNGTATDNNPTATAFFQNVQGVNFNTNLPSPGPGNVSFGPGDLASSATLALHGYEDVHVGYSGSTPPNSIPAMQQPVGNFNVGLGGAFNLTSDGSVIVNTTGTATIFGGSSIQVDTGVLNISTAASGSAPIILGGDLFNRNGTISLVAGGLGGILSAGGTVDAQSISLASDGGNIGSAAAPIVITPVVDGATTSHANVTANTGGNGSVYLKTTGTLNLVGNSATGSTGLFMATAPSIAIANGDGVTAGSVTFKTASLQNDGTITTLLATGSGLTVQNDTGALTVSGAGNIVSPSAITLTAAGNLTISATNAALSSTSDLSLTATKGTLTLASGTLSVAQDSSGNGGKINITANNIVNSGPAGPLVFNADGKAGSTGNGGTVEISLTSTTPVVVGSATGNIEASANAGAGGGNGGTIGILTEGNLTVDATKLSIAASGNGKGGALILAAGSQTTAGNLIVNGDLHVDGAGTGDGGSITLASSSKSPLIIGTAKVTNGTSGMITAKGVTNGVIVAVNLGTGGVTTNRALTDFDQVELVSENPGAGSITINAAIGNANTSQIFLLAQGSGKISDSSKAPLTAGQIIAGGGSGTISLINIAPKAMGTVVSAFTSAKSAVAITATNDNDLNVAQANGSTVTIKAPSQINVGNVHASTLTVETTSKTGGSIGVYGNAVSTGNLTVKTAGMIFITGTTQSSKNTAITASSAASTISISGAVETTSKGTILVSLPTSTVAGGFNASTGTIAGGGAVTLTATKTDMQLNNVTSNATIKATAATGIVQNTGSINGATGVTLATTSSTGGAGGITLQSVTSGTPTVSGSAGGAISVTAAGGILQTLENGVIEAFSDKGAKASILLENKLVTGATPGSIVIGDSSQITTSGKEGSNIDIVMGAITTKSIALPTIAGLTFTPNTTPPIYLGLNGVTFNTAAGLNPIAVTVLGTGPKIVFNTGALPASAITVNGGQNGQTTLIQADPPVVSNGGGGSGVHVLAHEMAQGAGAASTHADNTVITAPVAAASSIVGGTAATSVSSIPTLVDTSAINALAASRTLYGGTSIGDLADAPVAYSVRSTGTGEIDATMLTGGDIGVSGARPGLTEAVFGGGEGASSHTLRRGSLLVAPDKDSVIDTAFGQVNVAAGAVALVVSNGSGTAVYNLDDTRSGAVVIKVGAETIKLAPGRHTTITSHQIADFHSANLAPAFAYRNVSTRGLEASNLQAFSAEFSMPHALVRVKQLRELVNSNNPRARKLAEHMLKTTAIMSQTGRASNNQAYQMFVPAFKIDQTQMAMGLK